MDKMKLGSMTARGGFANEKSICQKFNNWQGDKEAQAWLTIMGYEIEKISSVQAVQIPTRIGKKDVKKFSK